MRNLGLGRRSARVLGGLQIRSGPGALTNPAETLAGTGGLILPGSAALLQTAETLAGTGGLILPGAAALLQTAETLAGTGNVLPPNSGNLLAWFRADVGITLNGSTVSQWNDISGNGHNAVQATGSKQPTFNASDANFNSRPSLTFVHANVQALVATGVAATQANTIYVVGKYTSASNVQAMFEGAATRQAMFISSSKFTAFAGSSLAGQTSDTNAHMWCCVFNGASSAIYTDNTTSGITGNAGAVNLSQLSIGGNAGSGDNLDGQIAEVLVYSGADNGTNRAAVAAYVKAWSNINTT